MLVVIQQDSISSKCTSSVSGCAARRGVFHLQSLSASSFCLRLLGGSDKVQSWAKRRPRPFQCSQGAACHVLPCAKERRERRTTQIEVAVRGRDAEQYIVIII